MTDFDFGFGPPPKPVWHYTTADSLLSIVRTKAIRLSHYAFMNDPSEGQLGPDFLKKFLAECIPEPVSDDFLEIFRLIDGEFDGRHSEHAGAFLVSFSEDGDLLSQWARYAKNGQGVALGFEISPDCSDYLYESTSFLFGPHALPVTYVTPGADLPHHPARDTFQRTMRELADRAEVAIDAHLMFSFLFSSFVPAFKHYGYREEKEWRLVVPFEELGDVENEDLHFKASSAGVVPFIEVPLSNETLKLVEVRLGPCFPKSGAWSVERFLRKHGLDIKVSRSELSFRG